MPRDAIDHLAQPLDRHHPRIDRLPPGGQFVEAANIHLAILRQRQRARDRGRGHRERMRRAAALGGERQALRHAKAVLLVDHHEAEIAVIDRVLKDRVGADQELDRAIEQPHQDRLALAPLGPARQQRDLHPRRAEHLPERLEMLARENFGRRKQRRLLARLDRDQHGIQGHHRLARANIALQQPQHRGLLRHVAFDLGDRARLRARQREGQMQLGPQAPIAHQGNALAPPPLGLDQQQREAVRQQFVIGEPVARFLVGADVPRAQRRSPRWPARLRQLARFDPFGQLGQPRQRLLGEARHARLGETSGQAIDRLALPLHLRRAGFLDVIGMDDLEHIAIAIEPPGDPARLAHRQQFLGGIGRFAEPAQRADIACPVLRQHPVRPAAAGTRGAVLDRGENDDHLLALARGFQIGNRAAADEAFGQVIGEILDPRQAELLERLHQLRPDAFERLDFGKQRIESLGAHRALLSSLNRHCELKRRGPVAR